jgi:hypothetical protein
MGIHGVVDEECCGPVASVALIPSISLSSLLHVQSLSNERASYLQDDIMDKGISCCHLGLPAIAI